MALTTLVSLYYSFICFSFLQLLVISELQFNLLHHRDILKFIMIERDFVSRDEILLRSFYPNLNCNIVECKFGGSFNLSI